MFFPKKIQIPAAKVSLMLKGTQLALVGVYPPKLMLEN